MEQAGRPPVSRAVLVTGCSSGMGQATARHLARQGWPVFATARRVETLAGLERDGCRVLALDVTSDASMAAAVGVVEAAHGAVGVLVNNAGYSQSGAIEAVPMVQVRAQFETNVFGAARMIQLVLPGMRRQRWGRIVNVSSMGGKLVFPGGGYYHATKYALEALSDALRFEVQGFGIDVVVVEPGLIRSGFSKAAVASLNPPAEASEPYAVFHAGVAQATSESYDKGLLVRLTGVPEDVARVIGSALAAARPKTRYTVSGSATVLLALRRLLSDRLWDRFVARSFPSPGR